ncbi:MAG: 50S ribosomal protein L4 [Holosporales bacterium]|nr:50S ribosomal protein L4 [Holosporales bacterium]
MIQFPVVNLEGKAHGTIDLDPSIFCVDLRKDCLAEVVRWQLARRQAGTHKALGRSEVHGTTKKMYKQKGTGRARHGSKDVVQFRGGGIVFGPVPHAHDFKLNKKFRALAIKMLLSMKLREENLVIVEDLVVVSGKTKTVWDMLREQKLLSALFVGDGGGTDTFVRAVRNLQGVDFIVPGGLNVYDGLLHTKLVLTQHAIEDLMIRLQRKVA